jgi:S1-C subfamily serine protease
LYTEHEYRPSRLSLTTVAVIAVIIVAGIVGNIYTYQLFSSRAKQLENRVATLQTQINALTEALGSYNQTALGNVSLSELYESVTDSVVLIRGYVVETTLLGETISEVSGSGFIYNFSGQMVVNTNFHVVQNASYLTVTFRNGHSYPADVLGSDPYADLAMLSADAPQEEFQPLLVVSSSLLQVGDLVIAVGNPYGLTGTMTTGIVSQLGRTITDPVTSGYPIAEVIQISTPINPGNSGGPLLNSRGQVVGITTAVVTDSQGIGFAVPSNTILREIAWLVNGDSYPHPWVGVTGMDMSYEIAQAMNTNTTFGWLIVGVLQGSPAEAAGLKGATHNVDIYGQTTAVGGDIILAINGTETISGDGVSNYLEEYTFPGQTVVLSLERNGHETTVLLDLGTRPQLG